MPLTVPSAYEFEIVPDGHRVGRAECAAMGAGQKHPQGEQCDRHAEDGLRAREAHLRIWSEVVEGLTPGELADCCDAARHEVVRLLRLRAGGPLGGGLQ